jgi:hypothetical protein
VVDGANPDQKGWVGIDQNGGGNAVREQIIKHPNGKGQLINKLAPKPFFWKLCAPYPMDLNSVIGEALGRFLGGV